MTDVNTLRDNLSKLSARDQEFAASLIKQAPRGLSAKQAAWVITLANRAVTPPVTTSNVGSFEGVIGLFDKAQAKLKYPKIRLQHDGAAVVLSIAGPAAKQPGTVNITDGGPFGSNVWYGRVTPGGEYQPSQHGSTGVTALLSRLAANPAAVASEYGKLTGHCCFCSKALDDERSTAVGYGPVCAENFGLPWGDTVAVDMRGKRKRKAA